MFVVNDMTKMFLGGLAAGLGIGAIVTAISVFMTRKGMKKEFVSMMQQMIDELVKQGALTEDQKKELSELGYQIEK